VHSVRILSDTIMYLFSFIVISYSYSWTHSWISCWNTNYRLFT